MARTLKLKDLIQRVKRKTGFGWRTLQAELEKHGCFCSWRSLHRWGTELAHPFPGMEKMVRRGLEAILEDHKAVAKK